MELLISREDKLSARYHDIGNIPLPLLQQLDKSPIVKERYRDRRLPSVSREGQSPQPIRSLNRLFGEIVDP
jgi:hypothetical protein